MLLENNSANYVERDAESDEEPILRENSGVITIVCLILRNVLNNALKEKICSSMSHKLFFYKSYTIE